jgi:acetaldehyde dehydrogenase
MTSKGNWRIAIIGSGNIGTDLMIKILRTDGRAPIDARW